MAEAPDSVCLIGVDDNEESDKAFKFYAENVHQPRTKLLIVHAVEPRIISSNQPWHLIGKVREQQKMEETQKIKRLQDKYEDAMRSHKIAGRISIVYYSLQPGKILCEVATKESCIMIILGNPSNPKTSSLGSTIDYVLKKAKCPVLITRQPGAESTVQRATVLPFETSRPRLGSWSGLTIPQRRISCPAMPSQQVPPASSSAKNVRFRRHSTVITPFRQLTLGGNGSTKLVNTDEGDETEAESLLDKHA